MDSYHSMIHQNLVLLSRVFPNLDMESKLKNGMFKKPNTKGMQSVFYSLMCIVNPDYCKKCVPWPVSFTSDNYKFRTAVIDFIKNECSDFEIPKLLPSLLNKAEGEKYVRFVFNFVTYVTKTVLYKKFGEVVLEKPAVNISYEENMSILDDIIAMSFEEDEQSINEYRSFVQNGNHIAESSVNELQSLLKDYQNKKQVLYADLKDALSYTNVTEETIMESVIKDHENEVIQLKRYHDSLRGDIYSVSKIIEHLIRLVNMKQEINSKVIDVHVFKSYLNEEFATVMKMPLATIVSALFDNKDSDLKICLKEFLSYGLTAIKMQMQRFLTLNPSEQHLAVCKTADDISSSSARRLDAFRQLNTKLDDMIEVSRRVISDLENQCDENVSNEPHFSNMADILFMLKSYDSYFPRLNAPVIERPLLLDFYEKTESDTDPIAKIKRRMQLTNYKKKV